MKSLLLQDYEHCVNLYELYGELYLLLQKSRKFDNSFLEPYFTKVIDFVVNEHLRLHSGLEENRAIMNEALSILEKYSNTFNDTKSINNPDRLKK